MGVLMFPCLCSIRARLSLFRLSTCGLAAIEFALTLPVMILLLLGSVMLSQALMKAQKLQLSANLMGQLLSVNSSALTDADIYLAQSSAAVVFPDLVVPSASSPPTLVPGWDNIIDFVVSSVTVTATPVGCSGTTCAYTAKNDWSVGSKSGNLRCKGRGMFC